MVLNTVLLYFEAIIEVKEDFLMYKTGVYRYSMPANYLPENNRIARHHALNILGYVHRPISHCVF